MAWDDVLQRDVSNEQRQQMNANMANNQSASGSDAYDQFWGFGKYGKKAAPVASVQRNQVAPMGDEERYRNYYATHGTDAGYQTPNSGVIQPAQPQDIYGANFGTFTGDAMDRLRAMGMLPPKEDPNAPKRDTRDYASVNQSIMRSALEALNNGPRATNPYGMNNSGYLASQAQVVGQEGQSLLNALRSQQASNAMRGIKQSDGLAQNQQNQLRMQTALGRNAALTGLETARYDKASEWDKWDTNNRQQLAQAVDSGNINRFNSIMAQRNTEYEQDRNRPFDQLKLASGVQDFEQQGRMNPLEVLYRQGQVTGQGYENQGRQLQNVRYGYGNDVARQTMGSEIDATNAQNRLSYLGNTQQYGVLDELGRDSQFRTNIVNTYRNNAGTANIQSFYNQGKAMIAPANDYLNDSLDKSGKLLSIVSKVAGMGG
jgi:hypothetical protein